MLIVFAIFQNVKQYIIDEKPPDIRLRIEACKKLEECAIPFDVTDILLLRKMRRTEL